MAPNDSAPGKRQQLLEKEAASAATKPAAEGERKTKLQDTDSKRLEVRILVFVLERRPGFRAEPLTLQPGLKFYSPPVPWCDPRSRHRWKDGDTVWMFDALDLALDALDLAFSGSLLNYRVEQIPDVPDPESRRHRSEQTSKATAARGRSPTGDVSKFNPRISVLDS
eukprot:Skav217618  [mRNA]  locus=scaffold2172:496512:498797:+ [translate_table: standard]